MYEALDSFLNVGTWTSGHWADEERFYRALSLIVGEGEFNADRMGDYMRHRVGLDALPEDHPARSVIDRCVTEASAIRRYLQTTGAIPTR
jgi:hypothetical protein